VKPVTIPTLPRTVHHQSPSREDKTRPVLRDIGDSALSIRPRPGLDPAPTLDLVQRTVWHGALGHFAILSPTTSGCPGMAGHSQGTSLQSTQQESTKHHLKAPRRLGLPSPYKRAGQGSTEGGDEDGTKNTKQKIDISSNRLFPLFSLRLGLDTLSRMLVTPTRAPRCKEIQTSPPAGRRAFFCPNQDKPPCVLLASPSRKETRSIYSLV
jgi:hypothetical protein